jgi:hypothetical protein
VKTFEFGEEEGYERTLDTVYAQDLTGQSFGLPEAGRVTVSFFSLFFWFSKVIETLEVDDIDEEVFGRSSLLMKKRMLQTWRGFVLFDSDAGTFEYSHDHITKNIVPVKRFAMAWSF